MNTVKKDFTKQIKSLEIKIEEAASGGIDSSLLDYAQSKLDQIAEKYQDDENVGFSVYKLFELQALIHFYNGNDTEALSFINSAIEVYGSSYPVAEELMVQIEKHEKIDPDYSGKPNMTRNTPSIRSAALIVLTILSALVLMTIISDGLDISSSDSLSFLSNETPTPYRCTEYGFVISFPGFPSSEHTNIDIQGVTVPYTQYYKNIDNEGKAYMVAVAEYSSDNFDFSEKEERGILENSINGMGQNNGATLVSLSNDSTFLGYPSAEANFSYSINEKNIICIRSIS